MKRHRQRGRLLRSSWRPPSGKRSASCTPVAVACLRGRGDRHGAGARAAALRAGGGPRRGCGHGRCTGMRPLAGASRAGRAEGLLVVSVCVRLRKRDGLDKTRDAPVTMRCARWHSVDGAAPRGADPCHSAHVAGRLVATRLQRLLQDHSRAAARRTLRHPEERRVGHLVAERSDELGFCARRAGRVRSRSSGRARTGRAAAQITRPRPPGTAVTAPQLTRSTASCRSAASAEVALEASAQRQSMHAAARPAAASAMRAAGAAAGQPRGLLRRRR